MNCIFFCFAFCVFVLSFRFLGSPFSFFFLNSFSFVISFNSTFLFSFTFILFLSFYLLFPPIFSFSLYIFFSIFHLSAPSFSYSSRPHNSTSVCSLCELGTKDNILELVTKHQNISITSLSQKKREEKNITVNTVFGCAEVRRSMKANIRENQLKVIKFTISKHKHYDAFNHTHININFVHRKLEM